MCVRKFRSGAEMNQETWHIPGSPEHERAMKAIWEAGRSEHRRFPPGVYKHRCIEELNAQTEAWQAENFRRFQTARRAREA